MKKEINFQNIEHFSHIVEDNELFTQYSNPQIAAHYDSNYTQLHFNPTLEEFQLLEKMQTDSQLAVRQKHIKFHWPKDTGLFIDVLNYLSQKDYEVGKLELLHLAPEQLKKKARISGVKFIKVTDETFEAFLKLNYKEDMTYSEAFAVHKQRVYRYQFNCDYVTFWMAYIGQVPVGSLILISSAAYLEVDNVLTDSSWRKKGIASKMLEEVSKLAVSYGKEVILLVDAEDSPREMYLNQGFQIVASQIHALKEL